MKRKLLRVLFLLLIGLLAVLPVCADDWSDAKRQVAQGLLALEERVVVPESDAVNHLTANDLISEVLQEYPSIFQMGDGDWTWERENGVLYVIPDCGPIGRWEQEQYETEVQRALNTLTPDMGELQKALMLHDYLAQHCTYDWEGFNNEELRKGSAYSALVEKKAVCAGYSAAYRDLLSRVGIESRYVTSDAMDHAWTIIKLYGNWYHVDVTWDDPTENVAGRVIHDHFLRSDSGIERHYGWESDIACTDTTYDQTCFWTTTKSAVWGMDGTYCYYLTGSQTSEDRVIRLVKRELSTGQENTLYTEDCTWEVPNSNQYWNGVFSFLCGYQGSLYFNSKDTVYRCDPRSGNVTPIYTYSGDGYLYGLMVSDGQAVAQIARNADEDGWETVLPISGIPAAEEVYVQLPQQGSQQEQQSQQEWQPESTAQPQQSENAESQQKQQGLSPEDEKEREFLGGSGHSAERETGKDRDSGRGHKKVGSGVKIVVVLLLVVLVLGTIGGVVGYLLIKKKREESSYYGGGYGGYGGSPFDGSPF